MMRQYEHGSGTHMVNIRYRDNGPLPDPSRPSATIVKVAFNEPDESGMGSDEDAADIDAAWDRLAPGLAGELKTEFVSRLRYRGKARLLLYSPAAARARIEDAARAALPSHKLTFEHKDDPQWELYHNYLPTPSEERYALDILVVQEFEQRGDPLIPKRDVRHFAYFETRAAADQFAAQVSMQGFKVDVEQVEGMNRWSVIAARDDSVEHPHISSITGPLAELAAKLGGSYDGWEAMLIKKKGLLGRLFRK